MSYKVIVSDQQEEALWVPMTRWLEARVGDLYVDWDTHRIKDDGDTLYEFRAESDAALFERVWLRPYKIFPYQFWLTFWLNDLGCRRMEALWKEKGWTPEVVFVGPILLSKKQRVLTGARSLFKPNSGWFFERERDALMFLFEA